MRYNDSPKLFGYGAGAGKEEDTREEKTDCEHYQGTEKDVCYIFYKADCRKCEKYTPKKPAKQPEK